MTRVFVIGMGLLSTAGLNLESFWDTLYSGTITYGGIEEFKNSGNYRVTIGARLRDHSYQEYLDSAWKKKYGKASLYSIYAALAALRDAEFPIGQLPVGRTAVCMGSTMGEIEVEETISTIRTEKGLDAVPEDLFQKYRTENICKSILEATGASGPVYLAPAACASGNYAIALGKRLIEWNKADMAIVGGVDVFSRLAFVGFQRLLSLTPDLCKPFDRTRKGLVVGEGCGIVILAGEKMVKARNLKVQAELSGVGLASDRYHMTSPHPVGEGANRAMNLAFKEAGLDPGSIDYVSAHGTGTRANDETEIKALQNVFGGDIPPVSSIKSMLGHAMGAASILEFIASVQMMRSNTLLPTVNFGEPDPGNETINFVPNHPQEKKLDCILSNSFAFGGQVSTVILKRVAR